MRQIAQQQRQQKEQELQSIISQPSSLSNVEKAERYIEVAMLYQHEKEDIKSLHKAVEAFRQAITLFEATDKNAVNYDGRIAAVYDQLGETYYSMAEVENDVQWVYRMYGVWLLAEQQLRWAMQAEPDDLGIRSEGLVQYIDPAMQKLLATSPMTEELQQIQDYRMDAWRQAATVALLLEREEDALQAVERELEFCREKDTKGKLSTKDTWMYDYAQCLKVQGELYLRSDQYDKAAQSFQQARDVFQRVFAELPDVAAIIRQRKIEDFQSDVEVASDLRMEIEEHQKALDEYNDLLQKAKDPATFSASFENDRGYSVGDLHAALGPMYLSTKALSLAEKHLRQAVGCFSDDATEDSQRKLAVAHLYLSMALDQQGECPESAEHRMLACQLSAKLAAEDESRTDEKL
ncbi:hypothetical protein FisN_26Hu130 [Fistulifera solaris]|uniref:Uncharacterized protein n=1 Tax=Fistulifera solaris TaxID=1519565 RepID=A0A1Z5JY43_FISSO|nr:hypothetical protein FisN_26Hu130 [Fistulifera solaris]|eukprot:GAX18829.1 hypothetical protein FisN_26Hu130 [Fistulifera solaris]